MELTIFTPTYNRAHLLERLYLSLRAQTLKGFEWVIVDDGSTDQTQTLVNSFLEVKNDFSIRYIKQENQGKHVAINTGAKVAVGTLFFIVDSDDYLSDAAVSVILSEWMPIKDDFRFGGVAFNKCIIGGSSLGAPQYAKIDCLPLDFRYKLNERGDKAEVIRTELFLAHPFPTDNAEKFCPEGLFFNRLTQNLRYINKDIYYCAYLPDGLTSQIFNIRKNSPVNTCLYYRELAESNIPVKHKLKSIINYYRFKRYISKGQQFAEPDARYSQKLISQLVAELIYLLSDSRN